MAKRKRRNSIWKNGKEYFWSPKRGRYERWITIGKRRICDAYNGGIQIPRDITSREQEYLLQLAVDSDDGELYWRLRDVISTFRKQKDGLDFSLYQKPISSASLIETAAEYIEKIELAENEEFQHQTAERHKKEAQQHSVLRNQLMLLERNKRDLKTKIKQCSPLMQTQKRDLGESDIEELVNALARTKSQIAAIKNKVEAKNIARSEDRDSVNKRLRLLFPNRGGKEILNKNFQKVVGRLFEESNQKNIALQVIEVYNAIGRCYNLRDKEFKQPTVAFAKIPKTKDNEMVLGRYENGIITLNEEIKGDSYLLRLAFAHELGHWLENIVCRMGPSNRQWLKQKQGGLIKNGDIETAPFNNYPMLCASDYAQTVRGCRTEIDSVAMQEIVSDPEVFARRCPEHFERLLVNFKEIL